MKTLTTLISKQPKPTNMTVRTRVFVHGAGYVNIMKVVPVARRIHRHPVK